MKRNRPVILGIVGDSAAGKTTLTRGLTEILGPHRVTHVCTDDYHRYDRRERAELRITALHPECNYVDIMQLHLERLHYGQPILKPVYDHSTGTLVRPQYVVPREFVIVEGLLGFSTPVLRQFYDIRVFLDPPEELRQRWKVTRDTARRGYTEAEVRAELVKREADSAAYVRPQREHADVVVRFQEPPPERAAAGGTLDVQLVLRPTIPHPDLTYLVERSDSASGIRLVLGRDRGRPADFLEIDATVSPEQARELERVVWSHLPEGAAIPAERLAAASGRAEAPYAAQLAVPQLLLAFHLMRQQEAIADLPFASPVAALSRLGGSAPPEAAQRTIPIGTIAAPAAEER